MIRTVFNDDSWDYAQLASLAKEAGGPNELIEMLVESGRIEGLSEANKYIVIALFVGSGLTLAAFKIKDYFEYKKIKRLEATNELKDVLIDKIHEEIENNPNE